MTYPKLNPSCIEKGIDHSTIDWAKEFAEFLVLDKKASNSDSLSTSQIRKFFGQLKRIQADFEGKRGEIPFLRVKLAYAVGRDKLNNGRNKSKIKEFYEEVNTALDALEKMRSSDSHTYEKGFNNLVSLIEAIVAYHKYYNGK